MKPNEHATQEVAPVHRTRNRLGDASSPYLLQHAGNPVDWYPWGAEAFRKARNENKPIFLSVGYSACHWCHVMAHESFENVETAETLNRNFVAVKVDREERPDIDAVYMRAVQAMTGRGGWPMSVFLTPEGAPFYGGTYFPDRPIYGMPAFNEVLAQVAEAWRTRREELSDVGEKIAAALRESAVPVAGDAGPRDGDTAPSAVMRMADAFDDRHGGFGGAPKFPQTMALEFLLRRHLATGDPHALSMATRTLDAMARGGIYDQVGGGFHRYATDEAWRVPHFEKMLYDNALLARVYLHAWQMTGSLQYRGIATGTLDYVIREMSSPAGGFCSAQDADSEGEEGRFYLWTPDGIRAAFAAFAKPKIGPEDTALFFDAYGVTSAGNFEGANILFTDRLPDALSARHGLAPDDIESRLLRMRRALFDARKRRVPPARDGKLLAGWNGLMLAAFAEAGRALARPDYLAAAEDCAAFLTGLMQKAPGRLFRSFSGGMATPDGVLEDHANVADGLLALYQATFDPRWFLSARAIGDVILARFVDGHGGFYDTSDDHERLIVRPREIQDGALPSGGSMATLVLLRLAAYTGEARYREAAESALSQVRPLMAELPLGYAHWLNALEFANAPPVEVAIVGENPGKFLEAVFGKYRPDAVVACGTGREAPHVSLLEGRTAPGGRTAAYVCRQRACAGPILDPDDLARVLDEPAPPT